MQKWYPYQLTGIFKVYKFNLFALCLPLQQDVSEFTHKLLDWLEDAFQMKAEEDR